MVTGRRHGPVRSLADQSEKRGRNIHSCSDFFHEFLYPHCAPAEDNLVQGARKELRFPRCPKARHLGHPVYSLPGPAPPANGQGKSCGFPGAQKRGTWGTQFTHSPDLRHPPWASQSQPNGAGLASSSAPTPESSARRRRSDPWQCTASSLPPRPCRRCPGESTEYLPQRPSGTRLRYSRRPSVRRCS
jgi:hypothetical protein